MTDIEQQDSDFKTIKSSLKESKERHGFLNLYRATLPLAGIFLLDILPSRLTLIIIGHILFNDILAFNSIFLSYTFTNFFTVFILSLSCGLDTLSKTQLRNIAYLRYAILLVIIGIIPYVLCCVFSSSILGGINQSIEILYSTSLCIIYLIPYSISYIIFAMLRKSLLQYLHTTLLIGFMFARLCIHLMIGYSLFTFTSLSFYSFLISDSISMVVLLCVTIITLSKMINLNKFLTNLFSFSSTSSSGSGSGSGKSIMHPLNQSRSHEFDNEEVNLTSSLSPESYFKEYINATMIPGTISCLEWWAVETFTFLVGALPLITDSKLTVFYAHSCWASFLLIFQMPMLGLSVAMAAIMTADIRNGKFYPAWYTFLQAMGSVVVYSVIIGLLVILGYQQLLNVFYPMDDLTADDVEHETFLYLLISSSSSIRVLFVISIISYSIAMCFLGIFVSVGRLARGGTFMLIGYYIFGLTLSIILGYIASWHFYGIWFGYCGGFLIWCLLSALYWSCTDWFDEMKTMKNAYDEMEKRQSIRFKTQIKNNYGSMNNNINNNNTNITRRKNVNNNNDDGGGNTGILG